MDNKKTAHFKGVDSVRVLPVIETMNNYRHGNRYRSFQAANSVLGLEGRLLAEYDPCSANFERQVDV